MSKYPQYTADQVFRMYYTINASEYQNTLDGIMDAVCDHYKLHKVDVVQTKSRVRELTVARQLFTHIARGRGYMVKHVTSYLNLHHTSIIYFEKSSAIMMEVYPEILQDVVTIKSKIKKA